MITRPNVCMQMLVMHDLDRLARGQFVHRDDDELTEMEEKLGQFTLYIPDVTIDDLGLGGFRDLQ